EGEGVGQQSPDDLRHHVHGHQAEGERQALAVLRSIRAAMRVPVYMTVRVAAVGASVSGHHPDPPRVRQRGGHDAVAPAPAIDYSNSSSSEASPADLGTAST